MVNKFSDKLGHRNGAKSPSGIENAEHHDLTGCKKTIDLVPSSINVIVPSSIVETAVEDRVMIRAFNGDTAVQYLWLGEYGSAPIAVAANNGIAIGAGNSIMVAIGQLVSDKSMAFKSSSNNVQVIVFES